MGFGTIRKLPSGNYQAFFRRHGKAYNAPGTFVHKRAAQTWLATQQAALAMGVWKPPAEVEREKEEKRLASEAKQISVEDYGRAWLKRLRSSGRSPNTLRAYNSHLENYIFPKLGALSLVEVTPSTILQWWQSFDEGQYHQKINSYRCLSSMFNYAVDDGLIESNPVHVRGALEARKEVKNRPVLTPAQVEQLAHAMPDDWAIAVWLGAYAGLRYSEMAGLQRGDIDLTTGTISVRRGIKMDVGGKLVVGPPKSRAGNRTLHITPKIMKYVEKHLDKYTDKPQDSWLLTTSSLNQPVSNRQLHNRFDRAAKAIGIPGLRYHDLRHTNLTWLARAGATNAELMARAGHTTMATLMIYQHATAQRDQELAMRLE